MAKEEIIPNVHTYSENGQSNSCKRDYTCKQ